MRPGKQPVQVADMPTGAGPSHVSMDPARSPYMYENALGDGCDELDPKSVHRRLQEIEDGFAALAVAKQEANAQLQMQQDQILASSLHVTKLNDTSISDTLVVLSKLTHCIRQVKCVSDLKTALAPANARLSCSARPQAVAKAMSHVMGLISNGVSEPHDECICGWPVKSINEWGVVQERIIVLSLCAVWRVNYDEVWNKLESCSHILMNSVVGVRRRARKDGISLLLARRDGRANPLLELKRAAFKHATKTKVAPIGGETPRSYERAYLAVPPGGEPTNVHEAQNKARLAEAMSEVMYAAIEACHALQSPTGTSRLLSVEQTPLIALN